MSRPQSWPTESAATTCCEIYPTIVPKSTREDWCTASLNTCEILCSSEPYRNDCDDDLLYHDCQCGLIHPDMGQYRKTLETFQCETWRSFCFNTTRALNESSTPCEEAQCGTLKPAPWKDNPNSNSNGTAPASTSGPATTSATANSSTGSKTPYGLIGGMVALGVVLFVILPALVICVRKRRKARKQQTRALHQVEEQVEQEQLYSGLEVVHVNDATLTRKPELSSGIRGPVVHELYARETPSELPADVVGEGRGNQNHDVTRSVETGR
ncbi:hypothetical protein M011DRAFT_483138 [Sporormia fimetaria CBS 119925]|uniref:DUF7707 domain-containing protein n=1 Tax=Sporormia fimetaria CBS 119925 TaxID=1340428 RepID=A0A6A6VKP4_9PLEO|nr:hypothetical protein M011DRAFT_483138 [Sporormia fimetaria CBS 119925]